MVDSWRTSSPLPLTINYQLNALNSPKGVAPPTSGADNSGDVTGGVYKARERIHRSLADLRLLAIPTSRRRVAACDLNWGRIFEIASTSRLRIPLSTVHCSMFVAQGVRAMLT